MTATIRLRHKIAQLRRAREWGTMDLARKSGRSDQMIRAIETGDRVGSLVTLAPIANALDITLPGLLTDTEYDE